MRFSRFFPPQHGAVSKDLRPSLLKARASQPQGELNGFTESVVTTRRQHTLGYKEKQRPLSRSLCRPLRVCDMCHTWSEEHKKAGNEDTWTCCIIYPYFFPKVTIMGNQHKQRGGDKSLKTEHLDISFASDKWPVFLCLQDSPISPSYSLNLAEQTG